MPNVAVEIARQANIDVISVKLLGDGASSRAWQISDGDQSFIVRTMRDGSNRPVTYQSEFAILRHLALDGCPVPRPILNSCEVAGLASQPFSWSITGMVAGKSVGSGPLSYKVASQLGHFLATLHRLPVSGYGRLCESTTLLCGQQQNQLDGICARWCWAPIWPYDQSVLSHHRVVDWAPQLIEPLLLLQTRLLALMDTEQVVVNHADLHGEHIFQQDNNLTGIIDFGAAFIGIAAWDFAVLAYYHGWHICRVALEGYLQGMAQQALKFDMFWRQVQEVAVVVALYKLAKISNPVVSSDKVARAITFIENALKGLRGDILL